MKLNRLLARHVLALSSLMDFPVYGLILTSNLDKYREIILVLITLFSKLIVLYFEYVNLKRSSRKLTSHCEKTN